MLGGQVDLVLLEHFDRWVWALLMAQVEVVHVLASDHVGVQAMRDSISFGSDIVFFLGAPGSLLVFYDAVSLVFLPSSLFRFLPIFLLSTALLLAITLHLK